MTRIFPIAALLLVAGCGQQEPPPTATNEAASAQATSETPEDVPDLEGQWSVAAIDGKPVSGGSAMTAGFAGGKASISSGCFRRAWTYTQKRNVVTFTADPGSSANCGGESPDAVQESAYAVVTNANIAIFRKDGSEANLSGTGGTVTLERR